jgi:hypothetical protein
MQGINKLNTALEKTKERKMNRRADAYRVVVVVTRALQDRGPAD